MPLPLDMKYNDANREGNGTKSDVQIDRQFWV